MDMNRKDKSTSIICESQKNDSNTTNNSWAWIKTFALVFVWVSMGMANAMVGSTVPDMRTRLGVNTEEISRSFAAMSIGGMVGAPLGVIGDRFVKAADLILSICLIVAATVFTLRPWSLDLWMLIMFSFIEGVSWTCLNAIGNSLIMTIWGDDGNVPMHLLHFGYPVGAVLSPLIAAVYVSEENEISNSTTIVSPTEDSRFADDSQIEIAYAIVGLIIATNSIIFLVFQICGPSYSNRNYTDKSNKVQNTWRDVFSPTQWGSGDKKFGLTIVILVMGFYFLLVASFKDSSTYYVTYAVDSDLGFSNSESAIYNSIISFSGSIGRACSILAAKFLSIQVMIFIEVYGMVAATVLMAFWGHKNVTGFWVCSILKLFFRDPIWPSIMTWTDKYIVLLAIVVGLSDMASKSSDAIFGWVLGYMYTYVGMDSMFYVCTIFGVLLCILLVIMHTIASRHGSRYHDEKINMDITESTTKLDISNDGWQGTYL